MQHSSASLDQETLRIVVAFDLGPSGARVLRQALAAARRHRESEVHVVLAHAESTRTAQWVDLSGRLARSVWAIAENEPGRERIRIVTHLRQGPRELCLIRLASQVQADCIVGLDDHP